MRMVERAARSLRESLGRDLTNGDVVGVTVGAEGDDEVGVGHDAEQPGRRHGPEPRGGRPPAR
jgi:hypothetical protein